MIEHRCRWHVLGSQVSMKELVFTIESRSCKMSVQHESRGSRCGGGTKVSCLNMSKCLEDKGSCIKCYFPEWE
jgi:hypothetical protein